MIKQIIGNLDKFIYLIIIVFFLVKGIKQKNVNLITLMVFFLSIMTLGWPFFLSIHLTGGLINLVGMGRCAYEYSRKRDNLFVLLGSIFLVSAINFFFFVIMNKS